MVEACTTSLQSPQIKLDLQLSDSQMPDYRIERLKSPDDCEQFAKNVQKTHPDLAKEARRRAIELRASQYGAKSNAEREALRAVYAFEEVRSQKAGRRVRASRTWQSIKNNGIIATVEKVVSRKSPTEAYADLVEARMEDFTFEAVVLRHPEAFSEAARKQAELRLQERDTDSAN